jgi:cysteinyl-tRNA synthetase
MANVWMHNGFLQVEGEKMSKSLGNFITIGDVLADWPGDVIRLNMLKTHYRQPIDWTVRGLDESARMLDRWYEAAGDAAAEGAAPDEEVAAALLDDLNTPAAITALHKLAHAGAADAAGLKASAGLLGLLQLTHSDRQTQLRQTAGLDETWVGARIDARTAARKAKDFAESDRIRDELAAMGVVLKDTPQGTTWEIAR